MADEKRIQQEQLKPQMGIFIRGLYLGSGTQTFRTKDGLQRQRSALVVALPGLAGALEIGCASDAALRSVQDTYQMGQAVDVEIDVPRAYNGRVYITGKRCGDISLDG